MHANSFISGLRTRTSNSGAQRPTLKDQGPTTRPTVRPSIGPRSDDANPRFAIAVDSAVCEHAGHMCEHASAVGLVEHLVPHPGEVVVVRARCAAGDVAALRRSGLRSGRADEPRRRNADAFGMCRNVLLCRTRFGEPPRGRDIEVQLVGVVLALLLDIVREIGRLDVILLFEVRRDPAHAAREQLLPARYGLKKAVPGWKK